MGVDSGGLDEDAVEEEEEEVEEVEVDLLGFMRGLVADMCARRSMAPDSATNLGLAHEMAERERADDTRPRCSSFIGDM